MIIQLRDQFVRRQRRCISRNIPRAQYERTTSARYRAVETAAGMVATEPETWTGCIAGALSLDEYKNKLTAAGFADLDVEIIRIYEPEAWKNLLSPSRYQDAIGSAFIRALKKP